MDSRVNRIVRTLRLRGAWLLLIPFFWFARPTPGSILGGLAFSVAGLLVRGWAAGHIRKDEELATGGPYAHTRNPLYLGSFLIGVGVTVAGAQPVFLALFAVFFLGVYSAQSRVEADYLAERYGEAYATYADGVPLLLPRPLPWRSGEEPGDFRMERYLANREWEAGLGVLVGYLALAAKWWWF